MLVIQKPKKRVKKTALPQEIQKIVEEVQAKEDQEIKEVIEEVKKQHKGIWDYPKDATIEFFDKTKSYELTGYRPITKTEGLDFDPSWFTESKQTFQRTGHYVSFRPGTKSYRDFWNQEYKRCREGLTVNGYTITGDHYFFLNYYQLPITHSADKAGGGRKTDFPEFYVAQYEFFHYYELAKRLRKHAGLMKARGVGFSEINAAIAACAYTVVRESITMVTCYDEGKLKRTLSKDWNALKFLDTYTDGGMFKLRQLSDTALVKKSGHYKNDNGSKIPTGWQSVIEGVVADDPQKIRGDRVDILIFDEFGSWVNSRTAFIQAEALVAINGVRFGIKLAGGTGGDRGFALEGLQDLYYNPETYDVLPFYHNYTQDGQYIYSAFFIPAFAQVHGYIDKRGYCDQEAAKEYYLKERAKKAASPKALITYSAEFCFNAEEAFALEGENKFNKVNIAEQLTAIRALKQCPPIDTGIFRFQFNSNIKKVSRATVTDVIFQKVSSGKIRILEHPVWTTGDTQMTNNLYVAGVDGIDIGMSETSELTKDPSDFCMVVKKRIFGLDDPKYVAIYKDRPEDVREAYEVAIALAMYYNCVINIEATRRGFVTWARDRQFMNYFMRRPSATYNDISKRKTSEIGSPATPQVIDHQTDLIRDFVNDYYYTIWFEDMLVELNRYTIENKRKFDIIAAMGQAELADEELSGIVPKAVKTVEQQFQDFGYYYDERGYKRFGIIPKQETFKTNFQPYAESDYGTIKTSDPRVYYRGI